MHFFDPKNVLVFYGEDRFNICFLLNFFEKEKDKLVMMSEMHGASVHVTLGQVI